MRRLFSFLLGIALLAGLAPGTAAAAAAPPAPSSSPAPSIVLDGLPLTFPVPPTIVDGRTMVPFRAIAEALGVTLIWHDESRAIEAYGLDKALYLKIGTKTMWVNGNPTDLDVPPLIQNDRTLVPLRAFSTAFGAQVDWNGETATVTIKSPVRPLRMMAFYALGSFPNRNLVPKFSDVAYGWSRLNADGTLNLAGPDYFWPEPAGDVTPERLLADAAAAGTRRYLMVQAVDDDSLVTNLVHDPAKIAQAADSIAALVSDKGFDGVMLDLEGLGVAEQGDALQQVRQGYVNLVTAVSQRMHRAGKTTGVCLPPPNGWYHGYDYAALATVADLMQIMAYGYVNEQAQPADQVDEAARMAAEAVGPDNRSKLLLGMLFYETPDTLVQKVGIAKRYQLGGISFWTLGRLTADQVNALDSIATRIK